MKTNKLWILALLAISFTGCYTSFAPRDYEQKSYGEFSEDYYNQPEVTAKYDSLDFLDEDYLYNNPEVVTINNNYPPNWAWDYYSPVSIGYCNWGGFYDPFYDPYWGPYYGHYNNPYYGGNVYVYGDAYFGSYYGGYGSSYYPSQTRYRTNRSHWTNLRNNGGRRIASRERRTDRNNHAGTTRNGTTRTREIRGFDLDRDLRVARNSGSSSTSRTKNSGVRTAGIRRGSDVKKAHRTSDLERRRVSERTKKQIKRNTKNQTRSYREKRVTRSNNVSRSARTSQARSKRVYSSGRTSTTRNSGSSRSYHKPSSRSSNRSSNVTQSRRNSGSTRSYSTPRSSTRSSSSSRSSYSSPSRSSSSSSRSSVSRSSSSSSRSSGGRASRSSRSSSRSSRGRR